MKVTHTEIHDHGTARHTENVETGSDRLPQKGDVLPDGKIIDAVVWEDGECTVVTDP